ncbi:MAG: tetratricopeptide repeat protein [Chloroflexi bacterium]|nr:tetratricopeptide repeat protein [Chloroflexota bacterium]
MKKEPFYYTADLNVGKLYLQEKEYDKAYKYFDAMIKKYEKIPLTESWKAEIENYQGMAQLFLGNNDKAITLFDNAFKDSNNLLFDANMNKVAAYLQKNDPQKALEILNENKEQSGDKYSFYNYEGWCQLKLDKIDKAIESFDKAIKKNPRSSTLYNNKAIALELNKNYNESINNYEIALKLNPDNILALNSSARLYYLLGLFQKARENTMKVKTLDPASWAFEISGLIELQDGNFEKAMDIYEEVYSNNPGNFDMVLYKANMLSGFIEGNAKLDNNIKYKKIIQMLAELKRAERFSNMIS